VAENQPVNKHRMNKALSSFAARLRLAMARQAHHLDFDVLALQLYALQFQLNPAYGKICAARGLTPGTVEDWTQIPFVPAKAFKELEFSSIPPDERTAVFHSSGTLEQKPSRHFHCAESLALYEASLWPWFAANCRLPLAAPGCAEPGCQLLILAPPPEQAPHSSLVHMFETVRQNLGAAGWRSGRSVFCGRLESHGAWGLDFESVLALLKPDLPSPIPLPQLILGTAFSFVHLLDFLAENQLRLKLPRGSRVMETGGYKNRSRFLPKAELHALITQQLGVGRENILCEYGMSELSSQAYESDVQAPGSRLQPRAFRFPPWARGQIISPETGREVADGETGLIRIFDLANVYSVAAIQTEDLGIRRGDGFELIGRAQRAEPRGCSLMTA
jgi:hypothetical protein